MTVYDGYTTRDPVILKFCGGGESVPEAISSGHELLVEFSTSPYGTFMHPAPAMSLHGFQLEVEVRGRGRKAPRQYREMNVMHLSWYCLRNVRTVNTRKGIENNTHEFIIIYRTASRQ